MPKLPSGYAWLRSRFLHQSKERHQAFILLLTFAVYTLYHASRKPLSVVKTVFHKTCPPIPDKNSHWCQWKPFDGDNWSQLIGSLEYVYLVCYAFAMFPCGHLAERLNLRLFLSFGMAASGLTTILFGLGYYFNIHVFVFYFAVQILGGFVQATGWPAVVTILSNWFGKGRRGLVMGVWNAHTNFGNMLGSIIAGAFVNYQWGASFVVPGLLLVIAAYIVFLVLVEHPGSELNLVSSSTRTSEAHQKVVPGYYGDVKTLSDLNYKEQPISFCDALCLPNVMAYSLALFFSKLVAYTFLYWLPNYLANVSSVEVSAEKAAWLSTTFDIGGICGGILAGLLSDNASSESGASPHESSSRTIYLRAVTCASMLSMAAPTLFFYQAIAASMSFLSLVVLFVCGGLVTGPCALITTAVSADLGTQPSLQGNSKALATVTAIIDGTGSLGAALGPFLTGILVYYGWHAVFMMLITADLIALAISLMIACRSRNGGVFRLGILNLRSIFAL
uniref:Sugar phosphate exchanger 3 n=1 Tax=Mesocestoides corti TaxID=53468 RepID=A0A5K3EK53_MESCO